MKIGDEIGCIDNCFAKGLVNGGKYRIVDIDNNGNPVALAVKIHQ